MTGREKHRVIEADSAVDDAEAPINRTHRIGVQGLRYPISVLDRTERTQNTVADIDLFVDGPARPDEAPVHRFVEVLNTVHGELTMRNLPQVLSEVQRAFDAHRACLELSFPYFMQKAAPASGIRSLMEYRCRFVATMTHRSQDFLLGVRVPVSNARPPGHSVEAKRLHNERSVVDVTLRAREFVWIEDVIEVVESCASAPVYPLLTASDEDLLFDQASANPRPMTTLVHRAGHALSTLSGMDEVDIRVTNHNPMHDHQGFAEFRWVSEQDNNDPDVQTQPMSSDIVSFSFGDWLRAERSRLRLSQAELADELEVTASFLSRLESDTRAPSGAHIHRLARILGHDPTHVSLRAGLLPSSLLAKIQSQPERFQLLLNRL